LCKIIYNNVNTAVTI